MAHMKDITEYEEYENGRKRVAKRNWRSKTFHTPNDPIQPRNYSSELNYVIQSQGIIATEPTDGIFTNDAFIDSLPNMDYSQCFQLTSAKSKISDILFDYIHDVSRGEFVGAIGSLSRDLILKRCKIRSKSLTNAFCYRKRARRNAIQEVTVVD
jgi:hypothetical protein